MSLLNTKWTMPSWQKQRMLGHNTMSSIETVNVPIRAPDLMVPKINFNEHENSIKKNYAHCALSYQQTKECLKSILVTGWHWCVPVLQKIALHLPGCFQGREQSHLKTQRVLLDLSNLHWQNARVSGPGYSSTCTSRFPFDSGCNTPLVDLVFFLLGLTRDALSCPQCRVCNMEPKMMFRLGTIFVSLMKQILMVLRSSSHLCHICDFPRMLFQAGQLSVTTN